VTTLTRDSATGTLSYLETDTDGVAGVEGIANATDVVVSAEDLSDEEHAKEIGVRLGSRGASDVADAQVVCSALAHRAMVATSDSGDIRALSAPGERLTLIAV